MTTAAICATREVSWSPSYYRGEQYDSDLALYYLRARYYNPATGRFMSRDPEDGYARDPKSLHKYLYGNGDPINLIDPTGRGAIASFALNVAGVALRTVGALIDLVGGTAAVIAEWAAEVAEATAEIMSDLAEASADAASDALDAAWDAYVKAIERYMALLGESGAWAGINRILLCAAVGELAGDIVESYGVTGNKKHAVEVTSGVACEIGLEIVPKVPPGIPPCSDARLCSVLQ